MFQKQLRPCNFIFKCKPYNSLVKQAKTTNANKMLITQRLCAFLALAQLLRNFAVLFFCSFAFNLTDTCIASPSFFTLIRKKATCFFYMFGGYFFPSTISILRTTEEFMPIKLRCFICGRIKDIASSNPKSTDFMFRGCRSLFIAYIVLAFTQHVSKMYKNAFIVQHFNFDLQLYCRTPLFDQ